ncbi:hypothetical protein LUZ60_013710 [Juncus effusus]|nr:hypothetical protein LUZ60_013710 [Juncus effusus]
MCQSPQLHSKVSCNRAKERREQTINPPQITQNTNINKNNRALCTNNAISSQTLKKLQYLYSAPMAAARRRASTWCCSFSPPPASPDRKFPIKSPPPCTNPISNPSPSPNPNSNPNPRPFLSRRILSPGRVSPIDSDPVASELATILDSAPDPTCIEEGSDFVSENGCGDLRFEIRGKDGGNKRGFVVELADREVLCENSEFFRGLIENEMRVAEVDDVDLFREVIELMALSERDFMRALVKNGVSRAVDLLEVSSNIKYEKGIQSCLRYIEATPWSESEEEKLKTLFSKLKFKDPISQDILSRLTLETQYASSSAGDVAMQLIQQITNSTNNNARKDMQSFVNSLLCKSSVYQKDPTSLNRNDLYQICHSCLNSLKDLFEEKSSKDTKPLIERVSYQIDNLTWLFEILVNNNISEEFVELWGNQEELVKLHETASPMVRYELSRLSAFVFIALGKGRLQCKGDVRLQVFNSWFGPILSDFGWLKRCPKGLDVRMLEETVGKALLTLSLVEQQRLFQGWFRDFSMRGTECPNLSRSFQVWWRRSFVRSARA